MRVIGVYTMLFEEDLASNRIRMMSLREAITIGLHWLLDSHRRMLEGMAAASCQLFTTHM